MYIEIYTYILCKCAVASRYTTCNARNSPRWEKKPACTSLHNAHARIPHANEVTEQPCSTWR